MRSEIKPGTGWIGVDLDGTLARYDGWNGPTHVGEPIAPMVARVKAWLAAGIEVRVFTARVSYFDKASMDEAAAASRAIEDWCYQVFGKALPVTCRKDYAMLELWDDRAVRVQANVGEPCCDYTHPGFKS